MATISAQPISRPLLSQPSFSFQANQRASNKSPMPKEDEASTKIGRGSGSGGRDIEVPHQSALSCERHHAASARASLGMQCLTKVFEGSLNEAQRR